MTEPGIEREGLFAARRASLADAIALGGLAAVWCWLFRALWLGRGLIFDGEVHEILLPLHHFLREQVLERHRFPLWNPHLFLGYPWLAAIQAGVLYPPSWLFDALLPVERALSWNIAAHFGLACATTYAFARRALGVGAEGAAVAAAMFAFNGHMVGNLGQLHNHATLGWAPLALLAIHEVTRPCAARARWIGVGGLALGLSLLGGMAQQSAYLLVVFTAFAVTRMASWASHTPRSGRWADAVLDLAAMAGLGVTMFAAQWCATDALLAESARAAVTGHESLAVAAGSLSGADLLGLLFPNLVGWGALGAFNTSFVGAVPLALVLAGVWWTLTHRDGTERFFAVVWLAALAFAAGKNDPLTRWLYELPGVALFHDPARAVAIALLAAAMLAARAVERLRRGDETTRRTMLAASILLGLVIGGVRLAYWRDWIGLPEPPLESYATEIPGPSRDAAQVVSLAALAVGLLALARAASPGPARAGLPGIMATLGIALLAGFATPFVRTEDPATVERWLRGPAALASVPRPGDGRGMGRVANLDRDDVAVEPFESEFRWASVTGFASLVPRTVLDLTRGSTAIDPLRLTAYLDFTRVPALLDLTSAGHLVARRPFPERGPEAAKGDGFFVYENPSALPRAFIVGDACSAGTASALRALTDGTVDPRITALVIDESLAAVPPCDERARVGPAGSGDPRRVRIVRDEPDRLEVDVGDVELSGTGGWLVILDRHAPGWRASVDGAPRPVVLVDVAFRAVALERGARQVVLTYAPFGQRVLLGVSLVAGVASLILAFAPRRGTRGPSGRAESDPATRAPAPAPPGSPR